VSFVFSAHIFLIPIFIFGIWLSLIDMQIKNHTIRISMIQILVGILLMTMFWREGEIFGDLRVFIAIIGFVLPFAIRKALDL
jgi:hypothetical protein